MISIPYYKISAKDKKDYFLKIEKGIVSLTDTADNSISISTLMIAKKHKALDINEKTRLLIDSVINAIDNEWSTDAIIALLADLTSLPASKFFYISE